MIPMSAVLPELNKLKNKCVEIGVYTHEIEATAFEQLKLTVQLPHLKQLAIMPDVHAGAGIPVGVALGFEGYICPVAVGVDLGCGVLAYRTPYKFEDVSAHLNEIKTILDSKIPVNANLNPIPYNWIVAPPMTKIAQEIYAKKSAANGLGTLGGGNHFIELGIDAQKDVWIIIHSGSRGFGHGIGTYYS